MPKLQNAKNNEYLFEYRCTYLPINIMHNRAHRFEMKEKCMTYFKTYRHRTPLESILGDLGVIIYQYFLFQVLFLL